MTKPPMTCEEVLKHLLAFLDREIDGQAAVEIEHHLETCRGCFSRAEFERKLKAQLRDAGVSSAPESLRARIKQIVDKF